MDMMFGFGLILIWIGGFMIGYDWVRYRGNSLNDIW